MVFVRVPGMRKSADFRPGTRAAAWRPAEGLIGPWPHGALAGPAGAGGRHP